MFGPKQLQIFPQQAPWLCAGFQQIRELLKEGKTMPTAPTIEFVEPQQATA
jgi:hypothetical protein